MQKRLLLNTTAVLALLLFAIMAGLGYAQEPALPTAVAGTPLTATFTYQGQLTQGGQPVSATCSMTFRLFDAVAGGSQVGLPITANITATDGLFTANLDFGAGAFDGNERWLDIAVQCPGDGAPVNLGRQALTATPYALYALNAAMLDGMRSSDFFQIGGNAVSADAILGTTSNHGLEIRINDQRVLTLLPHATSPNLVGGHSANTVGSEVFGAVIGGGGSSAYHNSVIANFGTVSGGRRNTTSGAFATVGGGDKNIASGYLATVGGGFNNTASMDFATVGGGDKNIASGDFATVGGGYINIASGTLSTVAGGTGNNAEGNYSFAAGRRAKANAAGCFVWGDSTNADVTPCTTVNRTVFRSSGGYVIYTNGSMTSGAYILSGGGSWNGFSARAYKENFTPVDSLLLLQRLADIEISTWNYITQDAAIRHIGPMADDFNSLVDGLGGEGPDYINSLDADGVALAAIQGLHTIVQAQGAEIDGLKAEVDGLAARLAALEAAQGEIERTSSGWELFLLLGAVLGGGFALYRRERGQP